MTDIFISYAREDQERARAIAGALESEGWSVFWDRDIPPGRDFTEYIQQKIGECRVAVVLWSPYSVASKWVKAEAHEAWNQDRLIPILIAPAEIPFPFKRLQATDLCAWQPGDRGEEFEALLSSIRTFSLRRAAASPSSSPDAAPATFRRRRAPAWELRPWWAFLALLAAPPVVAAPAYWLLYDTKTGLLPGVLLSIVVLLGVVGLALRTSLGQLWQLTLAVLFVGWVAAAVVMYIIRRTLERAKLAGLEMSWQEVLVESVLLGVLGYFVVIGLRWRLAQSEE